MAGRKKKYKIESVKDLQAYITKTKEELFTKINVECHHENFFEKSFSFSEHERVMAYLECLREAFTTIEDVLEPSNRK